MGIVLLTVPVLASLSPLAKASTPRIEAISWTKALVSRGVVLCERNCDSFAWRHGWEDTWTFEGSVIMEEENERFKIECES